MVHTEPIQSGIDAVRPPGAAARSVAAAQGIYFLFTGLWPIFGIDSFQAVTGQKTDLWLVYIVGALIAAIGTTLLLAAVNRRLTTEIVVLGIGSALALAAIDAIFVLRGVISWVYLLDAAAGIALATWWATALSRTPRPGPPPHYPHVEALLARGKSISPNGPVNARVLS